jgi:hypothetical protein
MKILYIGTPTNSDFMSDCLFHGLRNILGSNVIDATKINYMYDTCNPTSFQNFHGRGFTLSRKLHDELIDRTDIPSKIRNRYFDYVIYGASFRQYALDYLDIVTQYYPPSRTVFINGSDSERGSIQPPLINLPGIHFLRERLVDDNSHPISFAIPKELIVSEVPSKEYYLMPLVPGVAETYSYDDEQSYYTAYKTSLFGLTWKKAGWDCLRHYEILSQGCLPLFLDIHHLPETLMKTFPRKMVEHLLDTAVNIPSYSKEMHFNYNDRITITNVDFSAIEFTDPDLYGYYDIADKLLQYTKEYLTTEYQAQYVIDTLQQYN